MPLADQRGRALCAVFSPDGTKLATAGDYRTVIVWDAATRTRLQVLSLDSGIETKALAFSPDGKLLAAKTRANTVVEVWRTDTWQQVARLQNVEGNSNWNNAVVFSPDGSMLATVRLMWTGLWGLASITRKTGSEPGFLFRMTGLQNQIIKRISDMADPSPTKS